MTLLSEAPRLFIELARAALILPTVELGRRRMGAKPMVERMRVRGRRRRARDAEGRDRLRRAIGFLDHHLPGGANCYRRALIETALDAGAAAEPVRLGLKSLESGVKGHAWLDDRHGEGSPTDGAYDLEIQL